MWSFCSNYIYLTFLPILKVETIGTCPQAGLSPLSPKIIIRFFFLDGTFINFIKIFDGMMRTTDPWNSSMQFQRHSKIHITIWMLEKNTIKWRARPSCSASKLCMSKNLKKTSFLNIFSLLILLPNDISTLFYTISI